MVKILVEVGAIKRLGLSTDLRTWHFSEGFDGLRKLGQPSVLQACIDLTLGPSDRRFRGFEIFFPDFSLCHHVGMGGRSLQNPGHGVEGGHGLCGMHDPREGVVVPRRDGVEFVVMTTGATDGLAQKCLSNGVELLVDNVGPHFGFVGLGQNFGTEAQKSGGHDAVSGQVTIVGRRKKIPSQLHGEEFVIRQIVVEGVDHPVTPPPGVGKGSVFVQPIGVGVSSDVHPVSGPPFAVVGGVEQLVERLVEPFDGMGFAKSTELLKGRRQSRQRQMESSQELVVFGGGGWCATSLFEPVANEPIDGMFSRMCWGLVVCHWSICPVLQTVVQLQCRFFNGGLAGPGWARVWGPKFDPATDISDGGFRQAPRGRHPKVRVVVLKGSEES
ncbi:MAG TPA: hypothetical protein DEQ73_07285 [Phycisphaerales bacterium]|nr:hypothetical protein [Phycisphaerales bacterium]